MTATDSTSLKLSSCFCSRRLVALLLVALLGPAVLRAADAPAAKSPAKAASPPATNVVDIPQSVFLITSTTQEVRDPFFPKSARFGPVTTTTRTNGAAPVVVDLTLKAIFGTPARPFATINNVTFGVGEDQDVTTPAGKVRVLCVEIRLQEEVVVVELAGRRRELRFSRR